MLTLTAMFQGLKEGYKWPQEKEDRGRDSRRGKEVFFLVSLVQEREGFCLLVLASVG